MFTRREFIAASVALTASPSLLSQSDLLVVNDVHSQLNSTHVLEILHPQSIAAVRAIIHRARKQGKCISVAGGRHAMGGQQFGSDTLLIDVRKLNRVVSFDREQGIIEAEAGIEWPELINSYLSKQAANGEGWGIAQKQTGADRLTISGTMAANAHGRGLKLKPFIQDVESFALVDATGTPQTCSRTENSELFRLVIGGYGLFGVVTSARLRLVPRKKLERVVELRTTDGLMTAFEKRIADGFLYGDFQFAVERDSDDFLRRGVFSCYRPVPIDSAVKPEQKELSDENWRRLLYLAHTDPHKAFEIYSGYYLSTNGQIYWSDTHQLSIYPDNYHREIDQRLHAPYPASEVITEIDVPRETLKDFLDEVREDFEKTKSI